MPKASFNEFRFSGLNPTSLSNKYYTMKRVSNDESKIIVKVADEHILPTRYGYALILDRYHVVFLKDWQVEQNYYGTEVLLTMQYFTIKEWGDFEDFEDALLDGDSRILTWEYWLNAAKEQAFYVDEDGYPRNRVHWAK